MGILSSLIKNNHDITFICSGKKTKHENSDINSFSNITTVYCDPNDENSLKNLAENLNGNLDAAIFDTFVTEEMFSPFVFQKFPECLRILDTQDYHSLRIKRQSYIQDHNDFNFSLLRVFPEPAENEYYARELASYFRSDLVYFCSDYENYSLKKRFPSLHTEFISFFYPQNHLNENQKNFESRKDFVWIGNFNHPPNLDAVKFMIDKIWPEITKSQIKAELHLYGANFPKEIADIEHPSIKCKGLMKNLKTLSKYKWLLAPIRYGAGVKGKIIDSWFYDLPVITTPIGAEGMLDFKDVKIMEDYYTYKDEKVRDLQGVNFGGIFNTFDATEIAKSCISLYEDKDKWEQSIQTGHQIIKNKFSFETNSNKLISSIINTKQNLKEIRRNNPIQGILWSETLRSHEKLSKYIREKRKKIA